MPRSTRSSSKSCTRSLGFLEGDGCTAKPFTGRREGGVYGVWWVPTISYHGSIRTVDYRESGRLLNPHAALDPLQLHLVEHRGLRAAVQHEHGTERERTTWIHRKPVCGKRNGFPERTSGGLEWMGDQRRGDGDAGHCYQGNEPKSDWFHGPAKIRFEYGG